MVMVAITGANNPGIAMTAPAGWTLLGSPPWPTFVADSSAFHVNFYVWYKIASGEGANYTLTHATASTDGYIFSVSGSTTTGIQIGPRGYFGESTASTDGVGNTSASGPLNGTVTTTPGITIAASSLVALVQHNWELQGSTTSPAVSNVTLTERLDSSANLLYLSAGVSTGSGATGDGVQTANSNTLTNSGWQSFFIEVPSASTLFLTAAPVGLSVHEGDQVTFTASATGAGTLVYNWGVTDAESSFGNELDSTTGTETFVADFGLTNGSDSLVVVLVTDDNTDATGVSVGATAPLHLSPFQRKSKRERQSSTFDYSGAGWFDIELEPAGQFDRDMIVVTPSGNVYPAAAADAASAADSATSLEAVGAAAADAATVTDSSASTALFGSTATDALTASDAATDALTIAAAAIDSVTAAAAASSATAVSSTATDAVSAGDASSDELTISASASDAASAADAATTLETVAASATDAASAGDASTSLGAFGAAASDAAIAADAATTGSTVSTSASDAVSASDASTSIETIAVAASDAATVADSAAQVAVLPASASDAVASADSTTSTGAFAAVASDAASAGDSASLENSGSAAAEDAAAAGDVASSLATFGASAADAIAATDASTNTGEFGASAADAIAASDASNTLEVVAATATDAAAPNDAAADALVIPAAATDDISAGDSASCILVRSGVAVDAVTASDSSDVLADFLANAVDTIIVGDASTSVSVGGAGIEPALVWNFPIEGTLTTGDLLRICAAVLAGKTTISSSAPDMATTTFRAIDDSEVRVAADMEHSERTDVTTDEIDPTPEVGPTSEPANLWSYAIEGEYSAGDALKFIAAVLAGKTTITDEGAGAAEVTFAAVDGVDVRVAAQMQNSTRVSMTLTP